MFIAIIVAPYISNAQKPIPAKAFSFNLSTAASTSAGVYTKDGTLIRTLWSGQKYNAGKHDTTWDGKDDEGKLMPPALYSIKVLSNNVKYTWEGVLGNTSDALTGLTVHRSHAPIISLAIIGNNAYFATAYNESGSSTAKFLTTTPQKRVAILGKGISAYLVTADANNVYWAGCDAVNAGNWFVCSSKTNNDDEAIIPKSQVFKTRYGRAYSSAIDVYNNNPNAISTGIAVQRNGQYLFVAHQKLNLINVFDKNSGSLVQSLAFNEPTILADDYNGGLWVTSKKGGQATVARFKVNNDGKLISSGPTLTGLVSPVALAVSPDKKTLLVADAGESQQIKAYNNKSGILKTTFGKLNGYAADPDVSNDKFYFSDKRSVLGSAIAFQPDGSFWIEDTGNARLQHFSANFTYLDRVMYINTSYSIAVDVNNPERVFSDYLEFKIDYTKPLMPNNGSWKLVKNWGANIPPDLDDKYLRLHSLTTLSNKLTYATFYSHQKNKWLVAELPAHGSIRFTNSFFGNDNTQLYPDGSLRTMTPVKPGQPIKWSERLLLKFDQNNDPVWDNQKVLAEIPSASADEPIPRLNPNTLHSGDITSSNLIVLFGNQQAKDDSQNWHLTAIKIGDNKWTWRTAMGTDLQYKGPFPSNGTFDNGNHVRYSGSVTLLMDRSIIWGYYGEFWKNSEVNKWNHVYDDGLFVGQFGATGLDNKDIPAPPMFAGNAFSAAWVKDSTGNTYLYHNDESQHGGVHRWKITNMNSIKEQTIPIKL